LGHAGTTSIKTLAKLNRIDLIQPAGRANRKWKKVQTENTPKDRVTPCELVAEILERCGVSERDDEKESHDDPDIHRLICAVVSILLAPHGT